MQSSQSDIFAGFLVTPLLWFLKTHNKDMEVWQYDIIAVWSHDRKASWVSVRITIRDMLLRKKHIQTHGHSRVKVWERQTEPRTQEDWKQTSINLVLIWKGADETIKSPLNSLTLRKRRQSFSKRKAATKFGEQEGLKTPIESFTCLFWDTRQDENIEK